MPSRKVSSNTETWIEKEDGCMRASGVDDKKEVRWIKTSLVGQVSLRFRPVERPVRVERKKKGAGEIH